MLKQRLLTAALLIPVVIAALLLLPTYVVSVLLVATIVLAGLEWLHLTATSTLNARYILLASLSVLTLLICMLAPITTMIGLSSLIWMGALLLIYTYAQTNLPVRLALFLKQPFVHLSIAFLLLSGFVHSSMVVHQIPIHGPYFLLYCLVSVWLADTGGYFAGKRFGRHKLAVAISPNKTWEGVAGALVLSLLWAILFYIMIDVKSVSLFVWLVINVVVVSFSIVGDLFESVFKRLFNVKDSGNLLPGHGGILDRIDSLLAAVPIFAVCLYSIGAL